MLRGITKYLGRHHVALLALFLALGGTSAYAAASFINGKQIKPGSIPKNRLTKSAVRSLKGAKGAQGLPGQRGPTGAQGVQGVQGVQGPPGPTAGGVSAGINPTNPAGTLCCFQLATITTTKTTNLLVMMDLSGFQVGCNASGSCSANVGAYLDDSHHPVPNAAMTLSATASSTTFANRVVSGIVLNVAAGTHTVGIGWTTAGNTSISGGGDNRSTVIALSATGTAAPLIHSHPSVAATTGRTPVEHDRG